MSKTIKTSKNDYIWAGISISYLICMAVSLVDFIGKVPTCKNQPYGIWDIISTILMMFATGISFVNIYKISGKGKL